MFLSDILKVFRNKLSKDVNVTLPSWVYCLATIVAE